MPCLDPGSDLILTAATVASEALRPVPGHDPNGSILQRRSRGLESQDQRTGFPLMP